MDKGIVDIFENHILSLIIGTLLGAEITRFLYKPRVIIQIRDIAPLFSDQGFFISIEIANKGRTVASNCIGNITINYSENNLIAPENYKLDKFEKSLPEYHFEKINLEFPRHQLVTPDKKRQIKNSTLCWSQLGNPLEININPGASHALDFCRVQLYEDNIKGEKFWYLIFPCEQGWRKVRCRIKLIPKESFKGKLFICPNNVFPTVRYFKIEYEDTNQAPKIVLYEHNFFEKIYFFFNREKLYFD